MNAQSVFRTTQTQIGKTIYTVRTMPSERATETAEQKLLRLVSERVSTEIKSAETADFSAKKPCL